ncbi:MAG: hypothetical protein QM804_12875 [Propionicimonas sp.]
MPEPSAVYFQAPPGWPSAPPGVFPAAGWQPDPNLVPPPPGWVYYRDASGAPVPAPPGAWQPVPAAPAAAAPSGRRPKGLLVAVGVVALALVGAVTYVLWPKPLQLTTAQYSKLVTAATVGGASTERWNAYTDQAPGADFWPAPAATPSCEAQAAAAKANILRSHGGETADTTYVWVTLWKDAKSLEESWVLGEKCEAEVAAAGLGDPDSTWTSDPVVREKDYAVRVTRESPNGYTGMFVTIGNVEVQSFCGRLDPCTEGLADTERLVREIQQAARG